MSGPDISPLELIIVTLKTSLGSYLNLDMIAKRLILDEQVIGKKLIGVTEEGAIKSRTRTSTRKPTRKPKTKGKTGDRKDFSNQCTIIVHPSGFEKPLNLKVFGNGKIVITGGTTIDEGRLAVELFRDRIKSLYSDYSIDRDLPLIRMFHDVTGYVKYIQKNYLVLLKLFSLFQLNIDLKLDILLNKKISIEHTFGSNNLEDVIKSGSLIQSSVDDLRELSRMIQIYNICHMYLPNEVLLKNLEIKDSYEVKLVTDLYNGQKVRLPVTLDLKKLEGRLEVTTENYNTMFSMGFNNDREKFTKILNDVYKSQGIISSAKFEPSNYQGINSKYISRVHCKPDCTGNGRKCKCNCKEISFLIFQEGCVIVTGGRSWAQMEDGYRTICDIIKCEFEHIYVQSNSPSGDKSDNNPSIITEGPYVYLQKKSQIIENPRSYYILKKSGLLDRYL